MEEVKKKYGLWSGIAMVVGVVIGAGIFIKSGNVLKECGGNIWIALVAWLVGGVVMIAGAFCFSRYATRVTKFNGLVDYVEVSSNKRAAYHVAYFCAMLYYPITASNLAMYASQFIFAAAGNSSPNPWIVFLVAAVFLTFFFLLNYFSSYIADKFQISAMVIKLIPIFILVIVSLFGTLIPGVNTSIFSAFSEPTPEGYVVNFGNAIKITAFAYNGWVSATAINAEMKDSKKNLPRALLGGTIAVTLFYIMFFIGLASIIGKQGLIDCDGVSINGNTAAGVAFSKFMGTAGPTLMLVLIAISCAGNVNAMTLCGSRSQIAMAVRDEGFAPKRIAKITNGRYSLHSFLIPFTMMLVFLTLFTLARADYPFFKYLKTMDDIVCSLIYSVYIVIYLYMIKNFNDLNKFERYVMPIIAIVGSVFITFCGTGLYEVIANHNFDSFFGFLIFSAIILIVFIPAEYMWYKNNKKKETI